MAASPHEVVEFWFGPSDPARPLQFREAWFAVDAAFDAQVRERFEPTWERLHDGGLEAWRATPEGTLAYVIVADQFPRNCFRGTARAFASDALALAAAQALIEAGDDAGLAPLQRAFLYLPFEHAESLALQDRSLALFEKLARQHPEIAGMLDYARRHRDVIARFGRFPHRNAVLGRESTAAESAFLREPGSSF